MTVPIGDQLQCTMNVTIDWLNVPTAYTYQWQQSPNGTDTWTDLVGETRSDILITSTLSGKYVRCSVIASNASGSSSSVQTAAVGPVVSGITWTVGVPF